MTSAGPEDPSSSAEVYFTDDPHISLPPAPVIGDKIAEKRESVRGWLAGALALLLALLDGSILILAYVRVRPFNHDLLDILLAGVVNPVVVLVGAVLGFYFGEKASKST